MGEPRARARCRPGRNWAGLFTQSEIWPGLAGRWRGFRFILGPWPWMLLVYAWDETAEVVAVVTIQDARSANEP